MLKIIHKKLVRPVCRVLDFHSLKDVTEFLDFCQNEVFQMTEKTDMMYHAALYIFRGYLGYGIFIKKSLIGYCVIKNPNTHPETTTVIAKKWRGNGFSIEIRNYAIRHAIEHGFLVGDTIFSATHISNTPSLRSILRSGYVVDRLTEYDSQIHFIYKIKEHKCRIM